MYYIFEKRKGKESGAGVTHPLAVGLHIAALEGTVERVSVELLQESAAAAEEHVLHTPALIPQPLQNLPWVNHRRELALRVCHGPITAES